MAFKLNGDYDDDGKLKNSDLIIVTTIIANHFGKTTNENENESEFYPTKQKNSTELHYNLISHNLTSF